MENEVLRIIRCEQCHMRMSVPESALGGFGECLQCGKALRATESNTFPLPPGQAASPVMKVKHLAPLDTGASEEAVPTTTEDAAPLPPATITASPHACARCGRTFRGEWDVHETAEGRLCDICARRWRPQEELQEETLKKSHQVHQHAEMINPQPQTPAPQDPRSWQHEDGFDARMEPYHFDPRRWARQHRDTVYFVSISAVILLLSLVLPVEDWINYIFASTGNIDQVGDSPTWRLIFYSLKYLIDTLELFVMIFIGLKIFDKLPNETILNNAFAIVITALGLAFLSIFSSIPMIGMVIPVIQLGILYELYQLSFGQTIGLAVFMMPISLAGWLLLTFLLGVVGSFL